MMRLVAERDVLSVLPSVADALSELRDATNEAREIHRAWQHARPGTVHQEQCRRELAFVASVAAGARDRLASLGVLAADVDAGTVEFPSRLGSEVVHLVADVESCAVTHVRRLLASDDVVPLGAAPEDDASGSADTVEPTPVAAR